MAEHFGALALPVGEFLALEHGTEFVGYRRITVRGPRAPRPRALARLPLIAAVFCINGAAVRHAVAGLRVHACFCLRSQAAGARPSLPFPPSPPTPQPPKPANQPPTPNRPPPGQDDGVKSTPGHRFVTDRVARTRPRTPGEEVGQALVLVGPDATFADVVERIGGGVAWGGGAACDRVGGVGTWGWLAWGCGGGLGRGLAWGWGSASPPAGDESSPAPRHRHPTPPRRRNVRRLNRAPAAQ